MTGSYLDLVAASAYLKVRTGYIETCCRLMMSRADAKASKVTSLWMAYLSALLGSYEQKLWWAWVLISIVGLANFGLAEQRFQALKNETPEALGYYLTQCFEELITSAESEETQTEARA